MRTRFTVPVLIVVVFVLAYLAGNLRPGPGDVARDDSGRNRSAAPKRIVSLAPSITETLYAVGLADRIVGVTRFCNYPADALTRDKVGGYFDPNYEAILRLAPDLVVILSGDDDTVRRLAELDLSVMVIDHTTIEGILDSIQVFGNMSGQRDASLAMVEDIRARMSVIADRTRDLPNPRVLVSAGRSLGTGSLEDVYIAGRGGFYDRMLKAAGGVNAYEGAILFPAVSAEGIIEMNPDVILEMVADPDIQGTDSESIIAEWDELPNVSAVKNRRVHVFTNDYTVIPGPRFIRTLEDMARIIHSELEWE